jgi:hypothetical protein
MIPAHWAFLTPKGRSTTLLAKPGNEAGALRSCARAQASLASGAEGLDPPSRAEEQEASMKAVVQDSYGSADVLEVRDIDKPAPADDEVLVRVHAAGVDPGVWLLKELIEAGKVTPVIDRTYSLSEAPEAIRYLEEGHARGKVVITV